MSTTTVAPSVSPSSMPSTLISKSIGIIGPLPLTVAHSLVIKGDRRVEIRGELRLYVMDVRSEWQRRGPERRGISSRQYVAQVDCQPRCEVRFLCCGSKHLVDE